LEGRGEKSDGTFDVTSENNNKHGVASLFLILFLEMKKILILNILISTINDTTLILKV